ncbi:MAG: hypothetical protein KIS62_01210 [Ramlibacter sp.]|nr:hypothetical protein [Ramlibacter sp.]
MIDSLRRGMPRIILLVAIGAANLLVSYMPTLAGITGGVMPLLAPLCYGAGLVFLGLAGGDFALRILQPRIDGQDMAMHARRNNCTASALVYLGRCILAAAVLLLMVTASRAEAPPAAAVALLPVLKAEQVAHWPGMPLPSALGAQVEQETCITLRHRMCWSPRAELKTSREQGVGLGQLTRTWRADGSQRFDAMAEIVASFPRELAGLSWQNRYDVRLQLRALVLKDQQGYRQVLGAATEADRLAMAFAAYNGGAGGLAGDRRACAATPGCDVGRWFGHVERTSLKAKTAASGYGKSFFEINREYVRNIMVTRRVRYLSLEA